MDIRIFVENLNLDKLLKYLCLLDMVLHYNFLQLHESKYFFLFIKILQFHFNINLTIFGKH